MKDIIAEMFSMLIVVISIVSLFVVLVIIPISIIKVSAFNELTGTNYTAKQWIFCGDAIRIQHATSKVVNRE